VNFLTQPTAAGGIHVPAFFYGNGLVPRSPSVRDDLVHVSDLLPTLLSYADIPFLATQFDGISHWAAIQNSEPFSRTVVPINSASAVVYHFSAYIEVIYGVTYKYLFNPSVVAFLTTASLTDVYEPEGEFLYNLSADPSEEENLLETTDESPEVWDLLVHFRTRVLLFQEMSVPSQLEVIPPKLEVFPSKNLCWIPKDSSLYYDFVCPNTSARVA
jgi:arylsulfatase A-like enzyme